MDNRNDAFVDNRNLPGRKVGIFLIDGICEEKYWKTAASEVWSPV